MDVGRGTLSRRDGEAHCAVHENRALDVSVDEAVHHHITITLLRTSEGVLHYNRIASCRLGCQIHLPAKSGVTGSSCGGNSVWAEADSGAVGFSCGDREKLSVSILNKLGFVNNVEGFVWFSGGWKLTRYNDVVG